MSGIREGEHFDAPPVGFKIEEPPKVVGYYMLGDFGFSQPKKPNWFQRWCMKWILGLTWSDEWKDR